MWDKDIYIPNGFLNEGWRFDLHLLCDQCNEWLMKVLRMKNLKTDRAEKYLQIEIAKDYFYDLSEEEQEKLFEQFKIYVNSPTPKCVPPETLESIQHFQRKQLANPIFSDEHLNDVIKALYIKTGKTLRKNLEQNMISSFKKLSLVDQKTVRDAIQGMIDDLDLDGLSINELEKTNKAGRDEENIDKVREIETQKAEVIKNGWLSDATRHAVAVIQEIDKHKATLLLMKEKLWLNDQAIEFLKDMKDDLGQKWIQRWPWRELLSKMNSSINSEEHKEIKKTREEQGWEKPEEALLVTLWTNSQFGDEPVHIPELSKRISKILNKRNTEQKKVEEKQEFMDDFCKFKPERQIVLQILIEFASDLNYRDCNERTQSIMNNFTNKWKRYERDKIFKYIQSYLRHEHSTEYDKNSLSRSSEQIKQVVAKQAEDMDAKERKKLEEEAVSAAQSMIISISNDSI